MAWDVEGTDEFAAWFGGLSDAEQVAVGRVVELLVEHGPLLPFPYSSGVTTSRHRHMRELRVQHEGRPYRVLTLGAPRFCCSVATRQATTAGTKRTFPERTRSTTSICARSTRKV